MCVCSLGHPACNAHAPYCHLWPAPLQNIFPHYLINGTIFEKQILNTKCVFWFSLQLLSATFLIIWRTERDMVKNLYRSSCKVPVVLARFQWNLNFHDSCSSKSTQISNFMEIHPVGSRVDPYGRTDRQTKAQTDITRLIVAFRNFATALKKNLYSGGS